MYEYRVVERFTKDGKASYELAFCMNGRTLVVLPHSSPDREQMERIAALCTKEQVEPIHVQDVIYDMSH